MPDDPQGGNLCVWRLADPLPEIVDEEEAVVTTPTTPQDTEEKEPQQQIWQDKNGNVCLFKMSYKPTMEEV